MPFGYQLGSLFQSYQTDKVRRRCSGECLNLTMQARPTHVDNLRQAFHTEIRIGDILFNDTYDFIYQLFIRFAQSYRLRSDIRFLDKRFFLPLLFSRSEFSCVVRYLNEKGFSIYASAPVSSPLILLFKSFLAVSNTTGIWQYSMSVFIFLQSSKPSMIGIMISVTTISTFTLWIISNASAPLVAFSTEKFKLSFSVINDSSSRLSSTTKIVSVSIAALQNRHYKYRCWFLAGIYRPLEWLM